MINIFQDNDDDLAVMDSKQFREEIGEYTMVWDSEALQFKISIKDQSKFDRVSSQNMVLARASSLDKLIMI